MPDDMEKMFKPPKLDLVLHSPTAARKWKHWIKMLNNFFHMNAVTLLLTNQECLLATFHLEFTNT